MVEKILSIRNKNYRFEFTVSVYKFVVTISKFIVEIYGLASCIPQICNQQIHSFNLQISNYIPLIPKIA